MGGEGRFELTPLEPSLATECATMTFPAYRHLLGLQPGPRHPGEGDERPIQPLGVVAWHAGEAAGLALAELPLEGSGVPEVLSLFVRPESRSQGAATALVGWLEAEIGRRGFRELEAVYMTGKPAVAALERVFEKRRWDPPVVRTVTVRFTPEEAAATPWYGRVALSGEYEVFPWAELTPEERERLQRSHESSPWIAPGLEPWRHDRHGFDAVSSLGLRLHGEVVGWVINHRIAPEIVRFTCSFMRKDLGRRARILPLYTASIERLRQGGCKLCTFVTPVDYKTMVEFVRNRCSRWVHFVGETRGRSKRLAGATPFS